MHWPEAVLVGGSKHNKSGQLIHASALQTVVQIMGEREMYEYWDQTYKVHHLDWTPEKAAKVIEAWQRAFSKMVRQMQSDAASRSYDLYAFSTTALNDILAKYSGLSILKLLGGSMLIVSFSYFFPPQLLNTNRSLV